MNLRIHKEFIMVDEFRNKKTIIIGEVNTGKTNLLLDILKEFLKEGEKEITLIDMAPESMKGIGGKIDHEKMGAIRYYTAQIIAPRLTGKTAEEVEKFARHNANLIHEIFVEYLRNPTKVLFINDVSIYLQAGDLNELLSLLHSTPTVIMNGYYGSSLGGAKLGERERENMNALQNRCDRVIKRETTSS